MPGQTDATVCCALLSDNALSAEQAELVAPMLKALGDPVRLRLVSLVASAPDGEACVCNLNRAFDLSQPTISHHLKVLYEAGLVDRERRGVWVYYRARSEALASLGTLIGSRGRQQQRPSRALAALSSIVDRRSYRSEEGNAMNAPGYRGDVGIQVEASARMDSAAAGRGARYWRRRYLGRVGRKGGSS